MSGSGDPQLIAEGGRLFERSDSSRKIPSCASCHGANAEGAAIIPRLAGQHAAYIVQRLDLMARQFRNSRTMQGAITELKPSEAKAIAEFLQSR